MLLPDEDPVSSVYGCIELPVSTDQLIELLRTAEEVADPVS